MAFTIHITGATELRRVAALLRAEGTGPRVAKDITDEMHNVGPRIRAAFKAHALNTLPKRGGLNAWVAKSKVTFRRKRGALIGGMRVNVGRNTRWGSQVRAELEGIDRGRVIHPGNGFGPDWYGQSVGPNSIERPITVAGGRVLQGAVENAAEELVAGSG